MKWLSLYPFLFAVFFGAIHASATASDVATGDLFAAGSLFGQSEDGQLRRVIPLEHTEIQMEMAAGIIEATVIQTFSNPTDRALEAVYTFPLPPDATVMGFAMVIGDRIVRSHVFPKPEAREIYEEARDAGKKAALFVQARPNAFTTSLANFLPGETVEVHLRFFYLPTYERGRYFVRFPLTIGERYWPDETSPADLESADALTPPQFNANVERGHDVSLCLNISGLPVGEIVPTSHVMEIIEHGSNEWTVRPADGKIAPDRDFALEVLLAEADEPLGTFMSTLTEEDAYGLLTVFPIENNERVTITPRDFIFIIDHSGSMGGDRMESARRGLLTALDRLTPQDRFTIIQYDDSLDWFCEQLVPANAEELKAARKYAGSIDAEGGTRMQPALEIALDLLKGSANGNVILLTDGDVGNETSLIALLNQRVGTTRLFPIGIGSAPNAFLMKSMADAGRGFHRFVGPEEDPADIFVEVFELLSKPALSEIELCWFDGYDQPIEIEVYPNPVPDLFPGFPLEVVAHLPKDFNGYVIVKGRRGEQFVSLKYPVEVLEDGWTSLTALYGRRQIDELERERMVANPCDFDLIDCEITAIALRHQLVTRLTSRVAVEEKVSRRQENPLDSVRVPSASPFRTNSESDESDFDGDVIELSPFTVTTTNDVGYLSTNSTSGTSLNVAIKDLPMAIQVINREQISDLGASNLDETLLYSAGVFTDDDFNEIESGMTDFDAGDLVTGRRRGPLISPAESGAHFSNTVSIRGVPVYEQCRLGFRSGGLILTPDASVVLGGLFDTVNVERIEVVKGPHSVLYGAGAVGGIVHVIPARPLPEFRREMLFSVGTHDYRRGQVDFTGPVEFNWLPGELNWRFAGAIEDRGNGAADQYLSSRFWTAQLEYRPNDWMNLLVEYQHGCMREEGIDERGRDDLSSETDRADLEDEIMEESIDLDCFGGIDTSAERSEDTFLLDLSFYPLDGLEINAGVFLSAVESEGDGLDSDVICFGSDDGIGSIREGRERDAFNRDSQEFRLRTTYSFETDILGIPAIHTLQAGYSSILEQVDLSGEAADEAIIREGMFESEGDFSPIMGARQDIARHSFHGVYQGDFWDRKMEVIAGIRNDVFDEAMSATTHSIGCTYSLSDALSVYLLNSEGIRPNKELLNGASEGISSEETFNHEIGIKFEFWDGRISGNAAFFSIDRHNAIWKVDAFGVPSLDGWADFEGSDGEWIVLDERIDGWEFEAFVTPFDNLQFIFNYAYTDRETEDGLAFDPEGEFALVGKFSFDSDDGMLDGFSVFTAWKYTGSSKIALLPDSAHWPNSYEVSSEVSERYRFDLGVDYAWSSNRVNWKLFLKITNLIERAYTVTTRISPLSDSMTETESAEAQQTQRFYRPTSFRLGLEVTF